MIGVKPVANFGRASNPARHSVARFFGANPESRRSVLVLDSGFVAIGPRSRGPMATPRNDDGFQDCDCD
jgi:hypothetical protein